MNQPNPAIEINEIIEKLYQSFESSLNGGKNSHVHEIRKRSFEKFRILGFPDRKHEEYKYTPLFRGIAPSISIGNTIKKESELQIRELKDFNDGKNTILVFVNGDYSEKLSILNLLPTNGEFLPFEDACKKYPEQVAGHLTQNLDASQDPITALNTSFANRGIFIKIFDNQEVEHPVFVFHITDSPGSEQFLNLYNIIHVGKNSGIKIAEFFIGKNSNKYFENAFTSIYLSEQSRVNYKKIEMTGDEGIHAGTTSVNQSQQSLFNGFTVTLSGRLVRNNMNVMINGEHCETHLYGLYFLNQKNHVDNHTLVDHRKPNSFSNEFYKGIMDDHSIGVFNGKIYVQPGAQKTNAFQSNKNILLSDDATIYTKPQLEIWADDVKCSHGTTTGKLDESLIFYLRSRGMSEDSAKALLIYAFANELLEKISIDSLRLYIENKIQERLGQSFQ